MFKGNAFTVRVGIDDSPAPRSPAVVGVRCTQNAPEKLQNTPSKTLPT
jgi:hypothetical protein